MVERWCGGEVDEGEVVVEEEKEDEEEADY